MGTSSSTALLDACEDGDVATVRALLKKPLVNVNVRLRRDFFEQRTLGATPLHIATSHGDVDIVELLLNAKAKPNVIDMHGWTPLHYAMREDHEEIVNMLLKAGGNPSASAHNGDTLLHTAAFYGRVPFVKLLLKKAGVSPNATNNEGFAPLHKSLHEGRVRRITNETLQTLQLLVSFGAVWDTKCDEILASDDCREVVRALRECVLLWTQERADGLRLTNVPLEVVTRRAANTRAYIAERMASKATTFRRRICVIGPSHWGKTSLIKSLTSGEPALDHHDDRTIGIDTFSMTFEANGDKYHITFWDFAGQEEYQPAHAVFFSERTVYLVCIDLHSSSLAKTQADFRADDDVEYENRMDEFVSRKVVRWIQLVFARQPDAEFALVGTKADIIRHSAERIAEVKRDLSARLRDYASAYKADVGSEIKAVRDRTSSEVAGNYERIRRLSKLKTNAVKMAPKMWLTISCKNKPWVGTARDHLQQLLVKTKAKCFEMPESYSNVLNAIEERRHSTVSKRSRQRVHDTFFSYHELESTLKLRMPFLANCLEIVRTLHDLGEVLLYEHWETDQFRKPVFLDPLLLIDFMRQIFDHNFHGETMPHPVLMRLPFWSDIMPDSTLVCELKKLLQQFHLVYQSRGEMTWNSELMVPASWRSNVNLFHAVAGLPLRLGQGVVKRHVRWEYHFFSELPDAVFDHFVVATYIPLQKRVVGSYGILYTPENNNTFACRAVVERDGRCTVIRVEALAGEDAAEDDTKWKPFKCLVEGMETVLWDFPGYQWQGSRWIPTANTRPSR